MALSINDLGGRFTPADKSRKMNNHDAFDLKMRTIKEGAGGENDGPR
jgi:hypothetical protein